MKLQERRMAFSNLEVRQDSTAPMLTGYASTFNQPYSMGWYSESVAPEAFNRTLGRNPDVRLLINHEGLPLARTTSGTLELSTDSEGLMFRATLDGSDPDVQSLMPKVMRGDLNQASFGFRTIQDEWSSDMSSRVLRQLDLNDGDVSVVTYPANPATSVGMRAGGSHVDAVTSALRALESRAASDEEIVSVLTRALATFAAVDAIVDAAQNDIAEYLGIPNPDLEQDELDGTPSTDGMDDPMAMTMPMRAAQHLLELRKRQLQAI
jgi:HK97 family phage prohead protease